jgi:hypothetical protein
MLDYPHHFSCWLPFLLLAMLNPDYRQRPTVEAVSSHRFLTGAVLE